METEQERPADAGPVVERGVVRPAEVGAAEADTGCQALPPDPMATHCPVDMLVSERIAKINDALRKAKGNNLMQRMGAVAVGLFRCAHCGKGGDGWTSDELAQGRRWGRGGGVEYHCYEAYCD